MNTSGRIGPNEGLIANLLGLRGHLRPISRQRATPSQLLFRIMNPVVAPRQCKRTTKLVERHPEPRGDQTVVASTATALKTYTSPTSSGIQTSTCVKAQ